MMHIPDGFSEDEVLGAITRAVNGLVTNFCFGYYDADDLRQEGFMFACEALPRFDPNNAKGCGLENFLRVHVRNRFLNLRRDKLHRNSPPCSSCPFKVVKSKDNIVHISPCKEFQDLHECPKWSGWHARNLAKQSLVESCDASKITHIAHANESDICSRLSRSELLEHVSKQIPLSLRADYHRLLDGAKLSKQKREAVIEAVKELAGEILHDYEED